MIRIHFLKKDKKIKKLVKFINQSNKDWKLYKNKLKYIK